MQALNRNIRILGKLALRYALVWAADAVSIGVTALLLPGIYFVKDTPFWYLHAFTVALWFALLNVLVRPLLITLLLPINFVSLGLTTLVLNSGLFYVMHLLVSYFVIENFPAALVGLFVLSTVNTVLHSVIHLEEDYSFFAMVMQRLSRLTKPKETAEHRESAVVIIQIDGLSHTTVKRAINRGKMPFVADMLSRRGYVLKDWFSGLPSQTSAAQAGLFYGDRFNIPGFRWYDKSRKREIVSSNSSDMSEIDARYQSESDSLLKDGTCINTLIHGGASQKLMTLSGILEKDFRQRKVELEDFAIFSLHPFLYNRAIVLMVWDFFTDRFQRLLDIIRRKRPRATRNIKFSLLRAVGNAFLREGITYFILAHIVKGMPIIYANYIGYDMISHHAGPHSWDAMSALTGIDRQIKKIARTISKTSDKHYQLVILSDHGQSRSIPFESLYGIRLEHLLEDSVKAPTVKSGGNDAEDGYFATLLREMRHAEKAYGTHRIMRSRQTLEKIHTRVLDAPKEEGEEEGVVVCSTGNLAHVYFTEHPGRASTETIVEHYPLLIDKLASHPGIGIIITMNEEGESLAIGKHGLRRLRAGSVEDEDPLAPYNANDAIVSELRKLSEYPHAGDVILIGAIQENGAVVTFEDQIGTHGGLGGLQTEAFIIHPWGAKWPDTPVNNPEEMHRFLKKMIYGP